MASTLWQFLHNTKADAALRKLLVALPSTLTPLPLAGDAGFHW
jgi:hypothetical protein